MFYVHAEITGYSWNLAKSVQAGKSITEILSNCTVGNVSRAAISAYALAIGSSLISDVHDGSDARNTIHNISPKKRKLNDRVKIFRPQKIKSYDFTCKAK